MHTYKKFFNNGPFEKLKTDLCSRDQSASNDVFGLVMRPLFRDFVFPIKLYGKQFLMDDTCLTITGRV